jgi:hypothetical protein
MNDNKDYAIPPQESCFDPVMGPQGLRLALVFGNESKDGRCPFFLAQCMHCDIGGGEGIGFTHELNKRRLEYFKEKFKVFWDSISHLVIYNYGSTLNSSEFSDETLEMILKFAAELPSVLRISFDSREYYVTDEKVAQLLKYSRKDQTVSVTLGLESISEKVRVDHLKKKMSREQVEKIFTTLAKARERTAVEMNILFQPPGVVGNEAVKEAVATAQFGLHLSSLTGVRVDFNFHPYYPSQKGLKAFPDHPRARLEDALRAIILIKRKIEEMKLETLLFVGGNDEGHDSQPGLKQMKQLLYDPAFSSFNITQEEKDLII